MRTGAATHNVRRQATAITTSGRIIGARTRPRASPGLEIERDECAVERFAAIALSAALALERGVEA